MKATAIFIIGLALLCVFSVALGRKVFPPAERALSSGSQGERPRIFSREDISEEELNLRKARFAFSSFDLVTGLTIRELEAIPHKPGSHFFSFLFLLACIWLAFALRKPGSLS